MRLRACAAKKVKCMSPMGIDSSQTMPWMIRDFAVRFQKQNSNSQNLLKTHYIWSAALVNIGVMQVNYQ